MSKTQERDGAFFSRQEARRIIRIGVPVFMAQMSTMLMGLVDTVMTGHYRTMDMAAVALAMSIWMPISLCGVGVMLALAPLVAQRLGANERHKAPHLLRQGMLLALAICVPLMALLFFIAANIHWFGMEDELAVICANFLRVISFGLPGFLLFITVRGLLDADARPRPAMIIAGSALLLNIPCNYLLINGYCGLPELGGVGSAVANVLVFWYMSLALIHYTRKAASYSDMQPLYSPLWRVVPGQSRVDRAVMARIFRIGLPGALALLFEIGAFSLASLFLAPLGALVVAGHQIALNYSGILFMLPLSLCITCTIRVGRCLGEGRPLAAKSVVWTALCLGLGLAVVSMSLSMIFRHQIVSLYSGDMAVLELGAGLLLYVAAFQLVDAIQIINIGALRGYNDTRFISLASFLGYWCTGLPVGFVLARTDLLVPRMGAAGFWVGFVLSLSLLAVILLLRLRKLHRLGPDEVRALIER